ncbi:Phage integrase family protein [Paracoccus halophilus]|uniref:Phage integrase family protein n=1 Tax=Paracoccus halophilus TaxID=376733 RepID=A0A1I0SIA1_9RHOB|nr:tyrosine-type recombinase/integrase [Paracoccus halophilus]SFA39157.1 Phage integrase family protein [Paracoccus halophilus]
MNGWLQAEQDAGRISDVVWVADTTAGRVGDMNWLGTDNLESDQGGEYVAYQQQKRGSKLVSVPVQDLLRAELAHHDLSARDTFLVNEYGRPFALPAAMGNKVRDWIIEAGLCVEDPRTKVKKATRSQHGIRKSVAVAMASNDATVIEIMALLGHSEMKTTQVYVEQVNRRKLAASGRIKMSNMDHGLGGAVHNPEKIQENQYKIGVSGSP